MIGRVVHIKNAPITVTMEYFVWRTRFGHDKRKVYFYSIPRTKGLTTFYLVKVHLVTAHLRHLTKHVVGVRMIVKQLEIANLAYVAVLSCNARASYALINARNTVQPSPMTDPARTP